MPDTLGTVSVPEVSPSGTFPLEVAWPFAVVIEPDVIVHTFGAGNAKREQRFLMGTGERRWQISQEVTEDEWLDLRDFWEDHEGAAIPFTFNAPNPDGTTTAYTAQFVDEPLAVDRGHGMHVVTVNLREVYTGTGPTYSVSSTQTRFPSGSLATGLAAQAQQLIPLLKIQPRKAGYPAIYLSDRRCTVGGQLYLPRLLELPEIRQSAVGVPGSSAETDDTTFVLGNADRVMRDLAQAVMLDFARVEYSLYHVGTSIKLDLWAGEIAQEGWNVANDQATLRCTDRLANPFRIFPNRTIDRVCNAAYDKAPLCPFTAEGALDLVHFPGADDTFCDHGYETPNGCLAHGMERYYRGVPITPQPFRSKDNSGNFFQRLRRSQFVSMSQIGDSIIGQPLPAIFTDEDMPVKALLIAGADQGDFYGAVGIIGQGPLTELGDATKHRLDGQPQHSVKYPPRFVAGNEPAGATDYLSLSYNGNQTNGDWRKAYVGNSTYIRNLSAGLAFLDMLRTDEKGEQLTRLDTHDMEVIVRQGLSGWVWTSPGTRVSAVLTNPVWIAVNVLLWGLFVHEASAAVQETYFDCEAAIAAAEICDDVVDVVVGEGTETQFKFRGVIAEQRALRDWIDDILKNCLGYYTPVFGKLRIGIRGNSSAAAAFTSGNLLFRSVSFDPPRRSFNRYVISFADRVKDAITGETLYLPNTATAYDEDLAVELGGGDRAEYFQGEMNLPGTSSISQAQRIANTRLREEVGGVTEAHRLAHGRVRASTTILGLDFAAGQVVSVADEAVPGGSVELRAATWVLRPDYRIDFEGMTTQDSMYDLVIGPKPADVLPDSIPPEESPAPFRMQWHPNVELPVSGDPLFASGNHTFGLQQRYQEKADGSKQAVLDVIGVQPVTEYLPDTFAPVIRTLTKDTTGGSLEGDQAYWISVCAFNDDGVSPPCRLPAVKTAAGTDTNRFMLSDITWPAPPAGGSWSGYDVFMGVGDERTACNQAHVVGALPTSISITARKISTWGVPTQTTRRLVMKAKLVEHFGVFGEQITGVETGAVTIAKLVLAGASTDYTGRTLAVVADLSDGSANLLTFSVTSHDLPTGKLHLSPDPLAAGVEFGDLATILLEPNIYTGLTIGDELLVNDIYPGGLIEDGPNDEKGLYVRGITPGREHQLRRIVANTADTYTVDRAFDFEPTFFIVEEASWRYFANSTDIHNPLPDAEITTTIVVDNILNQPILVGGFIEERLGRLTPEELVPVRFTYLFGSELGEVVSTERATFLFEEELENPDQVSVPFAVTVPPGQLAEIYEVWASIDDPAVGGDITFDVMWSEDQGVTFEDSVFAAPQTLPEGQRQQIYIEFAATPMLIYRSFWLNVFISGIGSTQPGSNLTVVVRYRLRTDPNYAPEGGTLGGSVEGAFPIGAS